MEKKIKCPKDAKLKKELKYVRTAKSLLRIMMYTTRCLKNLKKRCNKAALISSALLAILPLAAGCGSSEQKEPETAKWAVYWYLCGSNLESKRGAASADIEELLQVHLKDDVKVVFKDGTEIKAE